MRADQRSGDAGENRERRRRGIPCVRRSRYCGGCALSLWQFVGRILMPIHAFWRWLSAQTLRGLLLLVPIIVTVEFIIWLSRSIEAALKPLVGLFIPGDWYIPGLALAVFLCSAFLLGLLTRNVLMRKFVNVTEQLITKTPVIGSIYPVVRQLTDLLTDKDKNDNGKVVLVSMPDSGAKVMGIVTQSGEARPAAWLPEDCDLVYVPLSYQVGGLTLILPRSRLQYLDVKPGEALQMIIMGGMVQPKRRPVA
jgi:uncharacterized membrane protein